MCLHREAGECVGLRMAAVCVLPLWAIQMRASPPPANRGLLYTANTARPYTDLYCLDKRFCDKIKGPPQLGFSISIFPYDLYFCPYYLSACA